MEADAGDSGGTRTITLYWGDMVLITWMICGNASSTSCQLVHMITIPCSWSTDRLQRSTAADWALM